MYAVIELGGRQWKVTPGSQLDVNRLASDVGAMQTVERVLAAHDGTAFQLGRPYVAGASVVCEILAHRQGPKEITYRYRRRENWRKTVGHRQPLTRLVVKELIFAGGSSVLVSQAAEQPAAKKPAAARKPATKASSVKLRTKTLKTPETRHGA